MKNVQKPGEKITLDAYLDNNGELGSHIASVRHAVKKVGADPSRIYITDIHEKDIVASTRRGIIHLDKKTLRRSTDAELEHRLRHEQSHVNGVFSEGLVELSIARYNKTGRDFYKREQARVKKITDILSPINGVENATAMYRQKKIKLLYRTFLLSAARKNIKQKEAHTMFIAAFPELEQHIQPRVQPKKRGHLLDK